MSKPPPGEARQLLSALSLRAAEPGAHATWLVTTVALVLVATIGCADYLTGLEVSFSIFYLLPIIFVTWFVGPRPGYLLSVLSAIAWLANDHWLVAHAYSHPLIPYWNAGVRLGFFSLVTLILSGLSVALLRERAAARLMSRMLSLVSHEFNGSIMNMGLTLDLLRRDEPAALPERRHWLYSTMRQQLTLLRQAVTNFLNASRMESGALALTFQPTMASEVVRECLGVLAPLSEQKAIRVTLEAPPASPVVRADPGALAIVVANLVSNAIKYTPERGTVTVRLLPQGDPPERLRISIDDTGIGLSDEARHGILSGHWRAAGGYAGKGYGLGLPLSQEMLRGLGAQLQIQSRLGTGSHFSFELPLWTGPAAGRAAA
jgi:signal transduction histidine kinase